MRPAAPTYRGGGPVGPPMARTTLVAAQQTARTLAERWAQLSWCEPIATAAARRQPVAPAPGAPITVRLAGQLPAPRGGAPDLADATAVVPGGSGWVAVAGWCTAHVSFPRVVGTGGFSQAPLAARPLPKRVTFAEKNGRFPVPYGTVSQVLVPVRVETSWRLRSAGRTASGHLWLSVWLDATPTAAGLTLTSWHYQGYSWSYTPRFASAPRYAGSVPPSKELHVAP